MSQRTRLDTGPEMIWFLMRSWAVDTNGLATIAMNPISSRIGPWLDMNACGVWAFFIMSTRLPTKASSVTSMSEPRKPATRSAAKAGHTGLMKCA